MTQKLADPVPAATMLLLRDEPEFQVLMVKRHHQIDFASGALVFPGGKPTAGDEAREWVDYSEPFFVPEKIENYEEYALELEKRMIEQMSRLDKIVEDAKSSR